MSKLPKPEPARAADPAEALDRVEFEIGWKKRHGEEEEGDVDMIPLIDVSVVSATSSTLLILIVDTEAKYGKREMSKFKSNS